MRRKYFNFTPVLLIMLLCAAGCTENQEEAAQPDSEAVVEEAAPVEESTADDTESETTIIDAEVIEEEKMLSIILYHPDEEYMQLMNSQIEVPGDQELPEAIVNALIEYDLLSEGVKILSFEEKDEDGVSSLYLDLSREFADYLRTMGTTGEMFTMGCLVNSFLDNYEAERMYLTVEGQSFESGHVEYTGYQMRYTTP